MARLLFPALNKLEAENGRLRSRVLTLEAELQEKTNERIQFHEGFKAEFGSLLDENLRLQRKLREANLKVQQQQQQEQHKQQQEQHKQQQPILLADSLDFRWENQRLKGLLEKQSADLKELQSLVDLPTTTATKLLEKGDADYGSLQRRLDKLRREGEKRRDDDDDDGDQVTKESHDGVCKDLSIQIAKNIELEMRLEEMRIQISSLEDELLHARHQSEISRDDANRNAHEKARKEMTSKTAAIEQLRNGLFKVLTELRSIKASHSQCKKDVEEFPNRAQKIFKEFKSETFSALNSFSEAGDLLLTRYLAEMKARKSLHDQLIRAKGNIRVFARIRPRVVHGDACSAKSTSSASITSSSTRNESNNNNNNNSNVVCMDSLDDRLIHVTSPSTHRSTTFELDHVFGPTTTQEQVFAEVAPLVDSLVDGFDVCIFAYGQTGSGKTYSMEGPKDNPGINQRALSLLFQKTQEKVAAGWKYSVRVSMLEIYNDNLRDLLSSMSSSSSSSPKRKLEVKKLNASPMAGQHVPGLVAIDVASLDDIQRLAEQGRLRRFAAETAMNHASSRSHALLVVGVEGKHEESGEKIAAKMHLVDLAGSERVAKSGANGVRLKETQSINRSLSTLGEVIHALRTRAPHIPYRNSKLTFLLERSLAGDSKTLLLLQVAQEKRHLQETLQTLSFGQRARGIDSAAVTTRSRTTAGSISNLTPKLPLTTTTTTTTTTTSSASGTHGGKRDPRISKF